MAKIEEKAVTWCIAQISAILVGSVIVSLSFEAEWHLDMTYFLECEYVYKIK